MSHPAQHEQTVKDLYQDKAVAESYTRERFTWAWSRLLHETQVRIVNDLIRESGVDSVLEVAPGPARISSELEGVRHGVMVEASEPMIEVARRRLREKGLEAVWDVRLGNAFDLSSLGRTFDFVFSFRFIRHFEETDRRRLYRELSRRLNPSGLLVFDVVNKPTRDRLDASDSSGRQGALPVHDATYTAEQFRAEMRSEGFEVAALHPVVQHMGLQSRLSHALGPRLPGLVWWLVRALERVPARDPLEWVAVCRKAREAAGAA